MALLHPDDDEGPSAAITDGDVQAETTQKPTTQRGNLRRRRVVGAHSL